MGKPNPFLGVKLQGQTKGLEGLAQAVTVEDNDRLVDEARLVFKDPDGTGAALFEIGRLVTVDLGWQDEHAVLFEGPIVESRPEAGAGGMRSVAVVARDLSHKMSQQKTTETTHEPGPLAAIVRKVAEGNGWSGDTARITCDPNPDLKEGDDLRQHDMTDYQYLQKLAGRYGARAFVEYNEGASRFYFVSNRTLLQAQPLGRLEYCRGLSKLVAFTYERVAARAAKQMVATAVDPKTGEVRTTTGEPPPRADGEAPAPPSAPTAVPGSRSDPGAAERLTVNDPTRVLGLRGDGRAVGTIMLRAKGKVEIVGLAPWAEGDWYVSKATHSWRDVSIPDAKRSSYETAFTATR